MKKNKKIISTVSIITLCMLMVLTSIPFVSAVSKPNVPKNIKYMSHYIAGPEHCLTFEPPTGGADGFHIVVKDVNGNVKKQFFIKSSENSSDFYKLSNSFVFWNFKRYIKSGQWYTVKVRAFNLTKQYKKSYKTRTKPKVKYTAYSAYGTTYCCEKVTGLKAKLINNKKNIKVYWSKVKGTTLYEGLLFDISNKSLLPFPKFSNKKNYFILKNKYNGKAIKKGSSLSIEVIPQKVVSNKKYVTVDIIQTVKVS